MSTSSLWQKVGASTVNCSLALLLSLPLYPFVSVELWKISTIMIFFVYNLCFRSRCLGMRLVGTFSERPTSILYAALYSLGFSTFFYSVWIPGDLLTANAVIQIGSVTMTGNTAHALLAGQGTIDRTEYMRRAKSCARLVFDQGDLHGAVDLMISYLNRWSELRPPDYMMDIGWALAAEDDAPGVKLWIEGFQ